MKNNLFKFLFLILLSFGLQSSFAEEVFIDAEVVEVNKENKTIYAKGNVKIYDKMENTIYSDSAEYNKLTGIVKTIGPTKIITSNKYEIEGENLFYDDNKKIIYSQNKTLITDTDNNKILVSMFNYLTLKNMFFSKGNIEVTDKRSNKYYFSEIYIDEKEKKIVGSDIKSYINDENLKPDKRNEPRLFANSATLTQENTVFEKGVFTSCKKRDGKKCPPWALRAKKIEHNAAKKTIYYTDAVMKIYDFPVFYFPKFFHPDPTVKRQSGFLMPSFQNSNNSGTSIQIPYYKVISERKDLTLFPRLFLDNEALLQTEYRQANKNSDLVLDLSVNKDDDNIKNHFFADLSSNKQDQTLNLHLETVSNDTYLKTKNITSPIINDNSSLNSYINYNSFNEYSSFEVSFEVYENLNETSSDRYEYIFPNFNYEKYLYNDSDINGDFTFNARGYQKNYDTNSDEAVLINDIKYSSFSSINSKINGMVTNYNLLLRNLNSTSENSDSLKDGEDHKILSTIIFESKLPLKKENQNSKSILSPKFSARYSPNATKNNSDLNKSINYEGIFALDRIDDTAVEGGVSFTSGIEYSLTNKEDQKIINLSFANIIRTDENPDLPKLYGFSEKRSDFIGEFGFSPSKFFDLNYQFSVDKDLSKTNYNLLKTNININNFVTSFEFLEEDNYLNENSYLINETKLNFDNNNSIGFGASKNLDQNITNYYNLIYEYENDCLTAAIEYNKSYYSDGDLRPEESIMFSIKIIPFGKIISPAVYN